MASCLPIRPLPVTPEVAGSSPVVPAILRHSTSLATPPVLAVMIRRPVEALPRSGHNDASADRPGRRRNDPMRSLGCRGTDGAFLSRRQLLSEGWQQHATGNGDRGPGRCRQLVRHCDAEAGGALFKGIHLADTHGPKVLYLVCRGGKSGLRLLDQCQSL